MTNVKELFVLQQKTYGSKKKDGSHYANLVHFDASVAELNPLSAIIEEIEVKEENTEEIGAGEEAVAEPEIPVDSDLQGFGDDLTEEERQRILEQTTTTEDSWRNE